MKQTTLRATLGAPPLRWTGLIAGMLLATLAPLRTVAADAPAALTGSQQKAREIFTTIIPMRTTPTGRQVPAMAEYLAGELRAGGFAERDVRILPLRDSASLVVRYRGTGRGGKPILLLSHMDVVDAKASDWVRDPFTLTEENGYFYGRGTFDVKNGVASLVATFLRLKAEGFVPNRDLIIYFSGDEETAQVTTLDTVRNHRELIDADFALNTDSGGGTLDEKTGRALHYALQTAEKTYADFELTARNPGGHSSLPRMDNAIYDLVGALDRLRAYRFPVMWNETTLASLRANGESTPGELGAALRRFADDPLDAEAADVLFRDPSAVGKTRTTCVATMLNAGHAANALPQSATATVNCRVFPGVPVEQVQRQLEQLAGPGIEVKMLYEPVFSDASPLRDDVISAVTRAVHRLHPGIKVIPTQEPGATDGAVFRGAGIPTYGVSEVFMRDSEMFAHGLDERIPVKSFYDGLEFWHGLLRDLAGPSRRR
jgi:acetylornithine deacetylase/succinyl-diaminopimelate desuccinylase-like protein